MDGPGPNNAESDSVIRFNCNFCSRQVHVPRVHAGKKGKCPHCKNIVLVPQLSPASPPPQPDGEIHLKRDSDWSFQTGPPTYPTPPQAVPTADQQYQMLRQTAGLPSLEPPPPPERKFPLLIDIFLYPANINGLLFLAIVVLLPLLYRFLSLCLGYFAIFLVLPLIVIGPIIFMYTYWYLALCVRDSAAGNIRAPDTISEVPGVGELFGQLLLIFACLAVCAAPAAGYFGYTRRMDFVFWVLAGAGTFIYPMTLLGVLMFDSVNGLNPLIIIPSLFGTFFHYCGLVVLIGAILFLLVQTQRIIPPGILGYLLTPVFRIPEFYLTLVTAHLLGRFYFTYQGKLNWAV
jgi:hypothetical protein